MHPLVMKYLSYKTVAIGYYEPNGAFTEMFRSNSTQEALKYKDKQERIRIAQEWMNEPAKPALKLNYTDVLDDRD